MKKYIIGIIMAVFAFIAILPQQAFAAETQEQEAVKLERQEDSMAVSVRLTLPNAAGEKVSSLQISLKVEPASLAKFKFDDKITKTAKVFEARCNETTGIMNVYIAGTASLYGENETALTLGEVAVDADSDAKVKVTASDVKLVRGSKMEELGLTDSIEFDFKPTPESPSPAPESPAPESPAPESPAPESPAPESPAPESPAPESPSPKPVTPSPSAKPTVKPTTTPAVTPKATSVTKLGNGKTGIVVRWKKSSNASGYYVFRKTAKTSWKRIATVKGKDSLRYLDKSIRSKNGVKYYYTVKAYNGSKVSDYDKRGEYIVRITAPTLTKATSKSHKKMLVKWKRNKKASGYRVQYSTSSKFDKNSKKITVKPGKTTSKTLSKLRAKKVYYVRIRCYKKVGKKMYYSGWSDAKKVTIK